MARYSVRIENRQRDIRTVGFDDYTSAAAFYIVNIADGVNIEFIDNVECEVIAWHDDRQCHAGEHMFDTPGRIRHPSSTTNIITYRRQMSIEK